MINNDAHLWILEIEPLNENYVGKHRKLSDMKIVRIQLLPPYKPSTHISKS